MGLLACGYDGNPGDRPDAGPDGAPNGSAPETVIDAKPAELSANDTATITFSSPTPSGNRTIVFECANDGATSFTSCTSPVTRTGLATGVYSLAVRARWQGAASDPTPATASWTVDRTAPETTITAGPQGNVAPGAGSFAFSSEAGATFECRLDGAAFASCTSPLAMQVTLGSHVFEVRAIDALGNVDASPAARAFTGDLFQIAPPETTIVSKPDALTAEATAAITFTSPTAPPAGATLAFECAQDGAQTYSPCTSPVTRSGLGSGSYSLTVRARWVGGPVDLTPETASWTVDRTAPETTITGGPQGDVDIGTNAEFTFIASEAGSTFECSLDGGAFAACTSPRTVMVVAGDHSFAVRASDALGNLDATPATRAYRGIEVVVPPPETVIDTQPSSPTASATATVTFSSPTTPPNGLTLAFECAQDGGATFTTCTSPVVRNNLGSGSYSLAVRARWVGSSIDPTPAVASWTVDRTAPETTITAGPMGDTPVGASSFTFTSEAGATFECSLDGAAYAACTSPRAVTVTLGDHTFAVRATDALGNVEATAATRGYRGVDVTPPETTITAGPQGDTPNGAASFTFASEAGATFQCRVDMAAFAACTSPHAIEVTTGAHTFEVRARDAAGNFDPSPASRSYTGVASGTPVKVRLVAGNITSGNDQSYDPGHGTRIFQGLKPDIVMIQEFNYGNNSAAQIRGWVDSTFGANFQYYRESGAQIPNGVISRYPILAAGTWEDTVAPNREFVWARIDVPGPKDLWAISVHLLTDDGRRPGEASNLVQLIQANVPATDYLVVGGDFNTDSRTEATVTTLGQVVSVTAPWPVDQAGVGGTNANRGKPYDWVMLDSELRALQVPVVIGSNSFPSGLVFDSRVYTPLASVAPVQQGDSGATNMQHMAVAVDVAFPQ